MIQFPPGARIWIAAGVTDMRRSLDGLRALNEITLAAHPASGHLFVIRGGRGKSGDQESRISWAVINALRGQCRMPSMLEDGTLRGYGWQGVVTRSPRADAFGRNGPGWTGGVGLRRSSRSAKAARVASLHS